MHEKTSVAQSRSNLSTEELLDFLLNGRDSAFEKHASDLVSRLSRALGCESFRLLERTEKAQQAEIARPSISLRGFERDESHMLVVASSDISISQHFKGFWAKVENPYDLPIIIACEESIFERLRTQVGTRYGLVLAPTEVFEIVASEDGLEVLRRVIRGRFPIAAIHPFDHHHPVTNHSFLGRYDFLNKIGDNPISNIAVVGPTKMGKTSLLKEYLRSSKGCGRMQAYCDLYAINPTDRALSRAIRMALVPSAEAYYDEPEHLQQFLRKVRSRFRMPLELVLDEVDRHCQLRAMHVLIHLAQEGVCRLVMAGRWNLMQAAVHTNDDHMSRLETIVLEPLSLDEALRLLRKPLEEMGFNTSSSEHSIRSAVNRCGRVPGHLQEFGAFLVEELDSERGEVSEEQLTSALDRVLTSSRLCGLLDDLSGPKARIAALLMALYAPRSANLVPVWLQEQFEERKIKIGVRECISICDELVIHHMLGFSNGRYRICRWDFIADGRSERGLFQAMLKDELSFSASESRSKVDTDDAR